MVNLLIYPSGYFDKCKIDEDLRKEYVGAYATGLFDIALFGYEKWFDENERILSMAFDSKRKAVYRGWMMRPDKYESFYKELLKKNVELVTTPEEYRLMHIFPNNYMCFGNDNHRMKMFPLHEPIDVNELKRDFERFMVKDYVKSVKGTDFT